ncbi:hypothetical protein M1437_04000 [Patescibacteria group bacterium]|nr:hypothetical protein [Patescibacteria group bacterium]MCL5784998.1 hypothetical protein [Patescibacteria group bacterium]
MNQKGLAPIFLIVAVLVVSVVAFLGLSKFNGQRFGPPQNNPGWGQKPGGAQDFGGPPSTIQKQRWNGPIPNPPKNKITYYKGLWGAGWFYPEEFTGLKFDPQKYEKWGVNIVMLQPGFEINSNGDVRYPPDFPTYVDMDARIGELATKFYQANVHIGLTLILTYKKEFSNGGQGDMWAGEPQPFPKEIVEKPGYFDKFNKVVEDMAKIAEKYHVYMFAPMGEADGIFGMKVAPFLTQQMVPLVRKYYTGKLYYKGDLHNGEGDKMNFKGYDVLGFVIGPSDRITNTEDLRKFFDSSMDRAVAWAKRDNIPEVVVSEHGYIGNNQMASAENIGLALEEGNKKLNGVFLTEPIPDVFKTAQGDEIVEQMKKWFLAN